MTTRKQLLTTTLAATAVLAAPALGASGVRVNAQKTTYKAGATAPATIPGTGLKRGAKIPSGSVIISRVITGDADATATATMTCKAGSVLKGIAPLRMEAKVLGPIPYTGKRSVRVQVHGPREDVKVKASLLALCAKA